MSKVVAGLIIIAGDRQCDADDDDTHTFKFAQK